MVIQSGVLELGWMDLKPRWRDIPRLREVTFDMLGKKAREAFEVVGVAYFNSIPGSWIGRVAVTANGQTGVIARGGEFCAGEVQKEAA